MRSLNKTPSQYSAIPLGLLLAAICTVTTASLAQAQNLFDLVPIKSKQASAEAPDKTTSLPQTGASSEASSNQSSPEPSDDTQEALDTPRRFVPSYGRPRLSMMLTKEEIEDYLSLLYRVEEKMFYGQSITDEELEELFSADQQLGETTTVEELVFPSYHLVSIIYNHDNEWVVKVNGITINAQTNDETNELYVTAISPVLVTFRWKPQKERLYNALGSITEIPEENSWAAGIEHRRIRRNYGMPTLDSDNRTVSFSLEPNQLFYAEQMAIYEGSPKDILPPPPPPPVDGEETTSSDGLNAATNSDYPGKFTIPKGVINGNDGNFSDEDVGALIDAFKQLDNLNPTPRDTSTTPLP